MDIAKSVHPVYIPIPPPLQDVNKPRELNGVTCTEVLDSIQQLKNKTSLDSNNISTTFITKIATELAYPLQLIFQSSSSTGEVPTQLKIAIVPIFKSGEELSLDNYRPIALLDTFSKIVCNCLTQFLDSNNILSQHQFGFRKKHSTSHPMLLFMNKITSALENKEYSIAIFCNLRKAFDSVNHKTLLMKLQKLGIMGTELKWFNSYLTHRKQFVQVNNSISKLLNVSIGVPQGSILGPLLFIIYINDLPKCSEFISFLFADDTTLLLSHQDIDFLITMVNIELKKISFYFRQHGLSLHPDKTKFLLFSNSPEIRNRKPNIVIDQNNPGDPFNPNLLKTISCVHPSDEIPAIRFLGVYFDSNLTFQYHIKMLAAKLSKTLYILRASKMY